MNCVWDCMWSCVCYLERSYDYDLGRREDEYAVVGSVRRRLLVFSSTSDIEVL